jgi:Spy/CpxP family protein refolding chaperone
VKNTLLHTLPVALLIVTISSPIGQAQITQPGACLHHGQACFTNCNATGLCWAQDVQQSPEADFRLGQGQRGEKRGRMGWGKERKHLEQFRLLKLLELLDLKEDQEVDFITAFRTMRRERRELHEKRIEFVGKLADGLREQNLSDDDIRSLIYQITESAKQEGRVMENFLSTAQKILTPQQLAKLIIFQERFEYELLEEVRAFRERPRPTEPMPGGSLPFLDSEDVSY